MLPVQICGGNVCPRIQTTRGDGPRQRERESPAPEAGSPARAGETMRATWGDGPPQPSLDHKARFVTRKGLGPLDKWIGREVTYEEATDRFWEMPGVPQ